ncbi:hypothetical protein K402DRAFT_388441 [Aulographum hederae CBS 113979]|uniref:AGC-kinase C-terminal domain-containing protein n=1 Tax=Aulographum hederae CBS 113979 TaxID=1176131 RepID=A0A6G1HG29_9PEZI|nr:hypothetical protein K402DRAFT_388441 [Aulographum hederae CBS 113979]
MFSYLRSHHKRAGSTPTSPEPPPLPPPTSASAQLQSPLHSQQELFAYPRVSESTSGVSESPVSPFPPVLPPIPRVSSTYGPLAEREAENQQPLPQHHLGKHTRNKSSSSEQYSREGALVPQQQQQYGQPENVDEYPRPMMRVERPKLEGRRPHTAAPTGYRSRGQSANAHLEPAAPAPPVPSPSFASPPPTSSFAVPYENLARIPYERNNPPPPKLAPTSSSTPLTVPKAGKSKLNLRNPMSLLLRRRSGQTLEHLHDESLITQKNLSVPAMTLPDGYDPRIRGTGVHDFSAPRPRRNFSENNLSTLGAGGGGYKSPMSLTEEQRRGEYAAGLSPAAAKSPKPDKPHTPMFKEHFDDEAGGKASESAVRAETLVNKAFLSRNSGMLLDGELQIEPRSKSPSSPPRRPPSLQLEDSASGKERPVSLATVPEDQPTTPDSTKLESSPRNTPPTQVRSRAPSGSSFQPAGLPSHLTSRSSRFSFQMAGVDSAAQEKVLEERHRKKAAEAKAAKAAAAQDNESSGEEDVDDYDYDDIDDPMGYNEEPIPLQGDTDDMYGEYNPDAISIPSRGLSNFELAQAARLALSSNPPSPADYSPVGTPGGGELRQGMFSMPNTGYFNMPHYSPSGASSRSFHDPESANAEAPSGMNSLRKTVSTKLAASTSGEDVVSKPLSAEQAGAPIVDGEDDMYFDDGLIDDFIEAGDAEHFDESCFDDPNHPLYERKRPEAPTDRQSKNELKDTKGKRPFSSESLADPFSSLQKNEAEEATQRQETHEDPTANYNTLEAYHGALAMAAMKAEADGRFARHDSGATPNDPTLDKAERPSHASSQPSLVPDDGRLSNDSSISAPGLGIQTTPPLPSNDTGSSLEKSIANGENNFAYNDHFGDTTSTANYDYDYDDYDSALEDDPIIAAANAEALANDDDGFYGQEFGFYATAPPSSGGSSANGEPPEFFQGGYFGPRGADAIQRNRSLREPNLTPITERSEYSARNSFVSLQGHFAAGGAAMPSPGLAQLRAQAEREGLWSPLSTGAGTGSSDDEMSLTQLMKLRRGAFGTSGGGSRSSSPVEGSRASPFGYFPFAGTNGTGSSPIMGRSFVSPVFEGGVDGFRLDEEDEGEQEDDGVEAPVDDMHVHEAHDDSDSDYSDYSGDVADFDGPDSPTIKVPSGGIGSPQSQSRPSGSPPPSFRLPSGAPTSPTSPSSPLKPGFENLPASYEPGHGTFGMSPVPITAPASAEVTVMPPFAFPAPSSSASSTQPTQSSSTAITSPAHTTSPHPVSHSPTLLRRPSSSSPNISANSASPVLLPKSHSRNNSATADSVAYVKERSEEGEVRWVVERRRTGEGGDIEVVERWSVEGGRI